MKVKSLFTFFSELIPNDNSNIVAMFVLVLAAKIEIKLCWGVEHIFSGFF